MGALMGWKWAGRENELRSTIEIPDMDAIARERQVRACVKNQHYAAEAHEVAASGLAVASFATEGGKESWLITARYAQETAALEAECARDRLLGLVGSRSADMDFGYEEPEIAGSPVKNRTAKSDAIEWCLRAIARVGRRNVRKLSI
jgi:hypothetical protein